MSDDLNRSQTAEPDGASDGPSDGPSDGTPPTSAPDAWTPSPRQLQRERIIRQRRFLHILIAVILTVVVFSAIITLVVLSPGWERVRETFFSWHHAREAFPDILEGFWLNVRLFLIAEPLILIVGIAVALTRYTTTPFLAPVRLLAVLYTDLLRGVPTILVVVLCGFGIPALKLQGVTNSLFWLALTALVLSYGAYVAEVIRAGIESVHPTQYASAQALGLSHAQTMRHVVLPQALRRVVPPLMNDFVSLQKDTALVAAIGLFDSLYAAQDYGLYNFNYTPLLVTAALFVMLTIPLARLTDMLAKRASRRERGGR